MEKSIDERARAYAKRHTEIHSFFEEECLRGGYYDGATEQKTRTLNKVYNIITDELGESCGTALIKVIQNAFGE